MTLASRLGKASLQLLLPLSLLLPSACTEPLFHPADRVDQDGDGFYAVDTSSGVSLSVQQLQDLGLDCDDDDDDTFPNAAELCDGKDNDCDGEVESEETDDDGDGFSECGFSVVPANVGKDDCDDGDPVIYPEATDICDGKDNDCDGRDLEGGLMPGVEADQDGDGYWGCEDCSDDPTRDSQAAVTNSGIDPPECSDYLREIAEEDEDALGTNCQPYEGEQTLWWPDFDGDLDAFEEATLENGLVKETCGGATSGFSASDYIRVDPVPGQEAQPPLNHSDCDDTSALLNSYDNDDDTFSTCTGDLEFGDVRSADHLGTVHPGAIEACDGLDNDLDGETDELSDLDGDGAVANTPECQAAYAGQLLDCKDDDPTLNQSDLDNDGFTTCGADSTVNVDPVTGVVTGTGDEDCNDGNSLLNLSDLDGDGYDTCGLLDAVNQITIRAPDCDDFEASLNHDDVDSDGVSSCDGDCNDNNPIRYPGAPAVCNDGELDNDCNLVIDPNEADLDGDGDTVCDGDCDDQNPLLDVTDDDTDSFTTCSGDCNDSNSTVYPGAPIACESGTTILDNDCNGVVDLNEADLDGDGFTLCEGDCSDFDSSLNLDDNDSDSYSTCTGDCDDNNAGLNPGVDADGDGWDVCGDPQNPTNGVPADCNDGDASLNWNDVDGDGAATCSSPPDCDDFDPDLNQVDQDNDGVTSCNNDCDDNNSNVSPALSGESSTRDGLDNDCDGLADEGQIFSGYVAVVELMISVDPSFSDGVGEYLELFNPYSTPVDLRGWVVEVANTAVGPPVGQFQFPSGVDVEPIVVPANSLMTLARANNAIIYGTDITNPVGGGAGFAWDAPLFSNSGGTVTFKYQNTTIDVVNWVDSASDKWDQGSAMSLRPGSLGQVAHSANNFTSNWCEEGVLSPLPGNNFGTPGSPPGCN